MLASSKSSVAAACRCVRPRAAAHGSLAHRVPVAAPWGGRLPTDAREYDVAIVGGGVTGTALLYSLARFTDVERIALVERRSDLSQVSSKGTNNSQTIHCGDIETNYTLQKAAVVQRQANMLRNFATKLPAETRDKCIRRMPKMALGAGPEECKFIENRYDEFRPLFPRMSLLDAQGIAEVEPKVMAGRKEDARALYVEGEHTAVDYYHLSHAFVSEAKEAAAASSKRLSVFTGTSVESIRENESGMKTIATDKGLIRAKYVVVSACGYSLLFAQQMGYGLQYSCVPVAGSFYFVPGSFLNGKVYTVQNPKLPFAAVHGDPDIVEAGKTRFGPTALMMPVLERFNNSSFPDFLRVMNPDMDWAKVVTDLMLDSTIRNYVLRNFLFEVPGLNTRLFARDAQKIIPTVQPSDLTYAEGFGGVRPQLINKDLRTLTLGEGRIETDAGIVFNITPSPGGTTCLGTAEKDLRPLAAWLGATVDEELLRAELLEGEYATPEARAEGSSRMQDLRVASSLPSAPLSATSSVTLDDFASSLPRLSVEEETAALKASLSKPLDSDLQGRLEHDKLDGSEDLTGLRPPKVSSSGTRDVAH